MTNMIKVWWINRRQSPPDPDPHGNADTYWLMDVSMDTCHRGDRHHVSLSAVPSESKSEWSSREGWTWTEESRRKAAFIWQPMLQCFFGGLLLHVSLSACCTVLQVDVFISVFDSFRFPSFLIQLSLQPSLDGLIYHPIENQLNYRFSLYIFSQLIIDYTSVDSQHCIVTTQSKHFDSALVVDLKPTKHS